MKFGTNGFTKVLNTSEANFSVFPLPPNPSGGEMVGKISKFLFSSYFDEIQKQKVLKVPEHESKANFSVRPTRPLPRHPLVGGGGQNLKISVFIIF